jgi:hypothetical protein
LDNNAPPSNPTAAPIIALLFLSRADTNCGVAANKLIVTILLNRIFFIPAFPFVAESMDSVVYVTFYRHEYYKNSF